MFAYREAAGPGRTLAPKEFIAALRRDTGIPALTCWWEPDVPRDQIIDGVKTSEYGCWVVFMKCRITVPLDFRGHNLSFVVDRWVDAYKLDGEYGCPVHLGAWVAQALNQSDKARRGFDRTKELNDLNEKAFRDPLVENRVHAEEMFKDPFVRKVWQMHADKFGMPTRIKEDVDKDLKRLEKRQRAMWDQIDAEAKSWRIYQERA